MKKAAKKGQRRIVWIYSGITLLILSIFVLGSFEGLENKSIEYRFRLRGNRIPNSDVVIVTVDEKSIAKLGRWPWSRRVHAEMVNWLTKAGAKVISFDVLFPEPDKNDPEGDLLLKRAAAENGRTIFGMFFQTPDITEKPESPLFPTPDVYDNQRIEIGSVNHFPESDGMARKIPTWVQYKNRFISSLSYATYALSQGKTPAGMAIGLGWLQGAEEEGDQDYWHELYLNFLGGYQTFPYYSFSDVLGGLWPAEKFKDKIILIGGTATALFDFLAVPNAPNFPGVEIHAVAIDNLINQNYMTQVNPLWTIVLIVLFGLGCGALTVRLKAWVGGLTVSAWVAGYYALGQILFTNKFLIIDLVAPITALVATYTIVLFYRFMVEEKEKRWIKGTFSQYLSPKIVEQLTNDPSLLSLGGEERDMTVFFSDVAGFTAISESMKPAELVLVLNEYLSEMSDIIFKHDGVVDKYIGDAIMAFWNAPVDQPRHATLACLTALEQLEGLTVLQKKFAERGLPAINCRIGINTGTVVVGNMGSKTRFDYTVMGDTVNLASRLEGANKSFGTRIMVSENTLERAKDSVEARPLDLLRVKGKAQPIKVFELLTKKGKLSVDQKMGLEYYRQGYDYYRDRKFQKSADQFKKVLESLPDDGPSRLYIQRCENFLASHPPKDWDGVFVMTTK